MPVLFRRVRGRVPGQVFLINPLAVLCMEQTVSDGTTINFSDVYAIDSRDPIGTVQALLEGTIRVCRNSPCDRFTEVPHQSVCVRCRNAAPRALELVG
jgi:hypothetical protein